MEAFLCTQAPADRPCDLPQVPQPCWAEGGREKQAEDSEPAGTGPPSRRGHLPRPA